MNKPLWGVAGVALLGTVGIAGAAIVASPGGEEEVAQQIETATALPAASETATASTSPTLSPTPASTPGETLTYSDPKYGYSFAYPSSWYLSTEALASGSVILYSYDPTSTVGDGRAVPPDKLKVFFWVAEGVDEPLEQWLAAQRNNPNQPPPPMILSTSDATLGGKAGLMQVVQDEYGVKHTSYYISLGDGRVFVANGVPGDSQVWPQFEPVLASLRFAQ